MSFKLTYATMFNPPAEMHERVSMPRWPKLKRPRRDAIRCTLTARSRGRERSTRASSPIDQRLHSSAHFALAEPLDVERCDGSGASGLPGWRATPMAERVRLLKRVARLIEERVYDIAAALTLEVGKNRMEALGEAQETADFFNLYADDFERHERLRSPAARRSAAGLPFAQPQRDAAVRRLGGHRAVQLSVRAGRRAGGGRADHRQHGRAQERHRYAVVRTPARRLHPRCRPAARRVQLSER